MIVRLDLEHETCTDIWFGTVISNFLHIASLIYSLDRVEVVVNGFCRQMVPLHWLIFFPSMHAIGWWCPPKFDRTFFSRLQKKIWNESNRLVAMFSFHLVF